MRWYTCCISTCVSYVCVEWFVCISVSILYTCVSMLMCEVPQVWLGVGILCVCEGEIVYIPQLPYLLMTSSSVLSGCLSRGQCRTLVHSILYYTVGLGNHNIPYFLPY